MIITGWPFLQTITHDNVIITYENLRSSHKKILSGLIPIYQFDRLATKFTGNLLPIYPLGVLATKFTGNL